jgi:hypothetical protein
MFEAIKFSLGTDNSAFKSGLDEAKHQVHEFKSEVTSMVTGLFAGIGIEQLVSEFAHIGELASGLGTTAEALQRVKGAADTSGTSLEVVAKAMAKLRSDGGKALEKLGIDAKEFAHAGMDEQVLMISKALEGIEDPQQRINTALEVFGVKGRQILPLFADGYEEIKKKMEGTTVVSNETVAKMRELEDEMKSIKNTTMAWAAIIGGYFVDAVKAASTAAGGMWVYFSKVFTEGPKAAQKAVNEYLEAYHQLEDKKKADQQKEQETAAQKARYKTAAEGEDSSGSGSSGGKSLAEREAELVAASAEKQLPIYQQLADLGAKRVDLERALAAATDPAAIKALEDEKLANTRERLSLEEANRKDGERFENQLASEKDRDLKKWQSDQDKAKKESAQKEHEQILSAFQSRQNSLGFANGQNPATGTGQRLAGVNYGVINSEAQKSVQLQVEMRNYLKSIEEKKWSVEIPDAT